MENVYILFIIIYTVYNDNKCEINWLRCYFLHVINEVCSLLPIRALNIVYNDKNIKLMNCNVLTCYKWCMLTATQQKMQILLIMINKCQIDEMQFFSLAINEGCSLLPRLKQCYRQTSNIRGYQIPKLKCFSSRFVVVFAQSFEVRC